MLNDVKISGYQLALLMMGFIFGSSAIINPAVAAAQDAWLAFILGWGGGFIWVFLYTKISQANADKTLIDMLKDTFGRYLGTVIALSYIWYFIHLAALVLRNFGDYMSITIYYETPMVFIIASYAILIAYTVKKGLEVFGRAAEMLMPYLFLFVILTFFLLLNEYDAKRMLPVLENGLGPLIKPAYGVLTFPFGETVAFLMVFPSLNTPEKLKRTALLALLGIGFLLLGIVLRDIWSLGPGMMMRVLFPPSLSTELTPGLHLDPIISVNLLIGGWIKVGICLYAACLGIAQIANLQDYKPLVLPVTIICVSLAIWLYENIFEMLVWAAEIYPYYAVPFQFGIPVLLLVIPKIKSWMKSNEGIRQRMPEQSAGKQGDKE